MDKKQKQIYSKYNMHTTIFLNKNFYMYVKP